MKKLGFRQNNGRRKKGSNQFDNIMQFDNFFASIEQPVSTKEITIQYHRGNDLYLPLY